ncbi:hypothetical protein [Pseudarthrobacter cellobiosi]|uniref:hypothetical protein n=1 Tax=Pseudarthrobacter cellobiosi TaxID=2953654 RepID=UPI00208F4670|nr:hypothetical protein [Pseudarthrobacter sp. HLT1-5]MCO4257355.1 hypothetical protein [Pseudarthrobacter sp. HLT1-5]
MTAAMYSASMVISPAGYARRIRAAERRVTIAQKRASTNPTPANREASAELEAGLTRLKAEAATI